VAEGAEGGIVIPSSDASPPTTTLQAGATAAGGESAAVNTGGSEQAMNLHAKTGSLNLAASAKDAESGIQNLEIWLEAETTTCTDDECSTEQLLNSDPVFKSTGDPKKPGDTTADSSIMLQALDLSKEIPQGPPPSPGSRTIVWRLYARSTNYLSGTIRTPNIKVTYKEGG
jgi:hypothetical protein